MSISKIQLSETLLEGYVKTPPTLKEQAFTKLAIQLCQSSRLKNDIICASDALTLEASVQVCSCSNTWENIIETRSTDICEAISLPPAFRSELISRMRWIALELFSWNKRHQVIFHTSAYDTDQFLTPSDWTIEGRLDEGKIAERLVRDRRIPVCRRYPLACIHSLEPYILPLWYEATPKQRNTFCGMCNLGFNKKSDLVRLKSYQIAERLHELHLIGSDTEFCEHQLKKAIEEGARTAFVNFWKNLSEDRKQQVIIPLTNIAISQNMLSNRKVWMRKLMENRYARLPAAPEHSGDILYFLFSQMSEQQRVSFIRGIIEACQQRIDSFRFRSQNFDDAVFASFLQWPYRDFFIPVITKLWGILPEERYAHQLLMLAYRYARHAEIKQEKQDFAYGHLLVELLEQTPAHYKRYVFSTTIPGLGSTWGAKILLELTKKQPPYELKDKNIFKRFLRQATPEERQSLINSLSREHLCLC